MKDFRPNCAPLSSITIIYTVYITFVFVNLPYNIYIFETFFMQAETTIVKPSVHYALVSLSGLATLFN